MKEKEDVITMDNGGGCLHKCCKWNACSLPEGSRLGSAPHQRDGTRTVNRGALLCVLCVGVPGAGRGVSLLRIHGTQQVQQPVQRLVPTLAPKSEEPVSKTCFHIRLVPLRNGCVCCTVGLCTLNQVDPCPITYSLSNP
jgi:hypothetical protein